MALSASGIALLAGGIVAGWYGRDRFRTDPTVTIRRSLTVVGQSAQHAAGMPDVIGLASNSARQAIADAGIDLSKVTVVEQPFAAYPGVVIDQRPEAAAPLPSSAVLVVAKAGKTPALEGYTADGARQALSQLGASVTIRTIYQAGTAENTVLATDPAAGQPLAQRVTLTVAEAPSSVFLDQLSAINSSCDTTSIYVNGTNRPDSIVCNPSHDYPAEADYALNRKVTSFQAVVGLGDSGATDTPVTFEVWVDGKLAYSGTFNFGRARWITVPTAGALRLRLRAIVPRQGNSGETVQAAFGGAKFVGGQSAISRLTTESHS